VSRKPSSEDRSKQGSSRARKPPSGTARRAEQRRQERLKEVARQVEEGTLVIRQMTPEERAKYPAKERPKRKRTR
jgi:hypothetical protein